MLRYTKECLKTSGDYELYVKLARKSMSLSFYHRNQLVNYVLSFLSEKVYKAFSKS